MSESSDNFGTKFCQFKGKYSAEYSAEYSVKLGRIFGIGRYQFFLYRSFTRLGQHFNEAIKTIEYKMKIAFLRKEAGQMKDMEEMEKS